MNHQEYTNVSDFIDNALVGEEKLKDIIVVPVTCRR